MKILLIPLACIGAFLGINYAIITAMYLTPFKAATDVLNVSEAIQSGGLTIDYDGTDMLPTLDHQLQPAESL